MGTNKTFNHKEKRNTFSLDKKKNTDNQWKHRCCLKFMHLRESISIYRRSFCDAR